MIISSVLTFTIPGSNEIHTGSCKDLSHTGISFETDQALAKGQTLEITIDSQNVNFEPMKATVEVIRIETSGNKHSVGCRILEFR